MADKQFVCSRCFRMFVLDAGSTWLSGERARCPYCKARDTTPMLEVRVDGRKLGSFHLTFKPESEIQEGLSRTIEGS